MGTSGRVQVHAVYAFQDSAQIGFRQFLVEDPGFVSQSQGCKIMNSGFTELPVAFDVGVVVRCPCDVGGVDAEASGQVCGTVLRLLPTTRLNQACFVQSSGLAAGLFQGETAGVVQVRIGIPLGQFAADFFTGLDLCSTKSQVHAGIAVGVQQEVFGVRLCVGKDEFAILDLHIAKIWNND